MEVFKYLRFISLTKLASWDYYSINDRKTISSNYKIAKLEDVLTLRKKTIFIEDDIEYKRCRVQTQSKGVILRDKVFGRDIKVKKQQLCKIDDFIVAEIDAKVGGYGIVPESLENAIVSSHYFLFEIDKDKISPEFLNLVVKQNDFFKQVKATGSTNYASVRPSQILSYEIPLPSIDEQKELIAIYNDKLKLSEGNDNKSKILENNLKDYFYEELGVLTSKKSKKKVKGLQFTHYSKLNKWGVDFIEINFDNKPLFIEKRLADICRISSGGTPSRSRKEYYQGGTIPWIKTGELNNDIIYDSEEKITHEGLKNSSAKLYPKNSLIIAMYGATIGKTAKLGIEACTNQACAVLFDIKTEIVDIDYLWEYLQTQVSNLKSQAYGSAQPNLNAGIISNLMIPVPSIEKQREISTHIKSIKNKVVHLNELSSKYKEDAILELGKKIFN